MNKNMKYTCSCSVALTFCWFSYPLTPPATQFSCTKWLEGTWEAQSSKMVLLGFLVCAAVTGVTQSARHTNHHKGRQLPRVTAAFFSRKTGILTSCIMRLNWFYFTTSTAVHKQLVPNPSITSKCKFPFFFFLRCQEQHICKQLYITFIFLLCTVQFFVMLFHIKFNSWFNVRLQPQAYTTYWCLSQHVLSFEPFTHLRAVVSRKAFALAQSGTHRACRHPCRQPNQPQPPQPMLWLPLKGLRAEWEALLMLLTYNRLSLCDFITWILEIYVTIFLAYY